MIKAIEKCSLQATFGPEITSITELWPKKSDNSSEVIHNAINPVQKRARFNKISLFSAKRRIDTGLLPMDPIDEEGNIPFDHTTSDDGTPVNRNGNIPPEPLINRRSMAAISTHEVPLISFQQSNSFGRIPLEIWRQKVSYHVWNFLPSSANNFLTLGRKSSPRYRHTENLSRHP